MFPTSASSQQTQGGMTAGGARRRTWGSDAVPTRKPRARSASLTAPAHAYTIPRGANPDDVRPDSYPRDRRLIYGYSRPIVVLINENSFSNAEIFAHSIRTAKRGRLVGKQTFGGVISTGSFSLIDGTTVREPFRGWYLPDGTDMENNGAKPDVEVEQTPEDEANGQDPQLEAAVKDLLRTIK